MNLPRERYCAGRRIAADTREDWRAITSMNGEAEVDVRRHRLAIKVAMIECTRQDGVTNSRMKSMDLIGPGRSPARLLEQWIGESWGAICA